MLLILLLTIGVVSCLPVRDVCLPQEFGCKNGSCLPIEWMCDNVPDCIDGGDESNCDYFHTCDPGFYMCRSGECMPKEIKCDGHFNCSDGSDERGCKEMTSHPLNVSPLPSNISRATSNISLCHPDDEFACKNGSCLPIEWSCDNVPDCMGGEDETHCEYLHKCPQESYMCRSGDCMPKEVKCNGHSDCLDGSDERGCKEITPLPSNFPRETSNLSLCHPDDDFTCKNGSCLPIEWMCDNVPDCLDGEDENHCEYLHKCPQESYMCRSGECMPKEIKCNGHSDCSDGSDENGCSKDMLPLLPSDDTHSTTVHAFVVFGVLVVLTVLLLIFARKYRKSRADPNSSCPQSISVEFSNEEVEEHGKMLNMSIN
uniref:Low-density lipoprotein receptor n=1 Tax=Panagrolaimus sp. ES5 TaxID=591445 RepID=A0AC34F2F4_9BILA